MPDSAQTEATEQSMGIMPRPTLDDEFAMLRAYVGSNLFRSDYRSVDEMRVEINRLSADLNVAIRERDCLATVVRTGFIQPVSAIHDEITHKSALRAVELHTELERIKAENAALREDAERYRWFKQTADNYYLTDIGVVNRARLDSVIDAARKAK